MEALQSCLDPSILSIFEDTPTVEACLDDESEATLLTALTEILDNVDEENLSPFDTLPDAELLSGQKGRELSPVSLRRLLCLSRSPPEKDALCGRTFSTGKVDFFCFPPHKVLKLLFLPRIQGKSLQRSDGEEEEDGSFTLSPIKLDSCPDTELLDWEGLALPLPAAAEQEDEGLSVSLGDLVRHMHPYCMAICVENEEGEQMLPEGGIVLEVVDQGENGEPILAIPDMNLPFSLPPNELPPENNHNVLDNEDSSELIVVDDDLKVGEAPLKIVTPVTAEPCSDDKDGMIVKSQKEEMRKERASWKKKKKKCKEQLQPDPVEGRVLRSARRAAQKTTNKTEAEPKKAEKERKVSKTPVASPPVPVKPKQREHHQTLVPAESTTTALSSKITATESPAQDERPLCAENSPAPAGSSQLPDEMLKQASLVEAPAPPAVAVSPASSESPKAAASCEPPQTTPPVSEVLPAEAPAVAEPKPKSLSLEEYRRLRQQKKPAPVEKTLANGTKWPSLPELPRELTPIPCLPTPSPKDPRRSNPHAAKKSTEEVRPAWHPRGPAAPPTPEALLVPPAYMVASSSRSSAPAPAPAPSRSPQQSSVPGPDSVKNSTTSQSAGPESCGPSVKPASQPLSSAESTHTDLSGGKTALIKTSQSQSVPSKSTESVETCQKTTTGIKPAAAAGSPASHSEKTTVVPPGVSEAAKTASLHSPVISDSKSSKPTSSAPLLCSSSCDPQRMKEKPVVLETKEKPTTALKPGRARDPTQELIEAFTSEIGENLLQFMPVQLKTLTPPATPPHQMWKPLAPMALLGKNKITEVSKSAPSKVIQIEARPLPSIKSRSKPTPAAAPVDASVACMDHDYCLSSKGGMAGEPGKRWNVKQQSFITIKPITPHAVATAQPVSAAPASPPPAATNPPQPAKTTPAQENGASVKMEENSILETPDASPARQETESTFRERSPRRRHFERSYRHHASSNSPSPTPSPKERTGGRSGKRKSHRSPSPMSSCSESDSSSSRSRSRSFSPRKKRSHDSVSRSPPRRRRYSYSSSRSGSWSLSRSRSRSPQRRSQCNRSRNLYRYSSSIQLEERRVVYVGRIRGTMTQKELKERFSYFGEIEECTLHFRDQGDNYGFVTYYDKKAAFTAIENGGKLRKPDELPFDLCFGGRRQFCQSSYADLDSNREYDPLPGKGKYHALDFDTLLKQAQQNLKR
uniref:PPARG related coactivator 1 n=1 Tax=Salarias fasciatus TaxID=181472 RepID=A0A672G8T0_SALFA